MELLSLHEEAYSGLSNWKKLWPCSVSSEYKRREVHSVNFASSLCDMIGEITHPSRHNSPPTADAYHNQMS